MTLTIEELLVYIGIIFSFASFACGMMLGSDLEKGKHEKERSKKNGNGRLREH